MSMKASSRRLARLAVLAAVGTVLLLLAHVIPAGRLGLMVIAGFPVCMALMMYGRGWAAGVFAVTAALGLLLFPGTASIGYAAFFGYYPILKSVFERLHKRALGWGLKYALYTAAFAAYWLLADALFSVGAAVLPWYAVYLLGAAVFWVYDRCFSLVIRFYIDKLARYFT